MEFAEDQDVPFVRPRTVRRRGIAGVPDPVDINVGRRLRLSRTLLGLSQEMLGQAVGLTFQKVQKYERGTNRMGASRLFYFATVLQVPVGWFFEEMPADVRRDESESTAHSRMVGSEKHPFMRRETLEFVRAFYRIRDPNARHTLNALIKAVARSGEDGRA